MPLTTSVKDLGRIGLIKDREPVELPPNAWSDGQNVRCVDGSISSFLGHQSIATITELPETMVTIKVRGITYITYCGNSTIYSVNQGVETVIGSGFSSVENWDSTVLGGVAVFTNFQNNPQYWGGEGNVVALPYDSTEATTCYWTDVGMKAKIIRTFRYHLFAMIIEDCDGYNPRKVHWSDPADPGTVPITWDPTKADYDAGFVELSETPGSIVDALPLRDTLQIYKSDGIWACTYTGRQDNQIFNFRNVTVSKGLYSRDCVCDIGGVHIFVGDGDIYRYDGTNFKSIADERVKDDFFDSVSRNNKDKTFIIYYERTGEAWLCYPTEGQISCNKAWVYNTRDDTWSPRDLPNVTAGVFGVVDRTSGYTYDSGPVDVTDYDTPSGTYTYGQFIDGSPFKESLILGGATDLFEMDRTNQAAGSNMTCYVRRTHLDLGDKADAHTVTRLYPHAEGDAFRVRLGYHNSIHEAVTWSEYYTFTPGTDRKIDVRETGRLHAIEFSSEADVAWKVSGHEVDFVKVGRR